MVIDFNKGNGGGGAVDEVIDAVNLELGVVD